MTVRTTVADRDEVRETGDDGFLRSAAHLMGAGVASQVLVAVTFAVVARGFGRFALGEMVTLLGVCALGQDLLDFGTSQWIYRELAAGRLSPGAARAALVRRLGLAAAVSVVAGGVGVLAGAGWPVAAGCAVYVVAAVGNAGRHAQLRAAGDFRRSALHTLGERLVWLVVVLGLVAWWNTPNAAAALVGSMGLAYAGSAALMPRSRTRRSALGGLRMRQMYLSARAFGVMGLFSDLQQLDASAAAAVAGFDVAADVGVASKLTGPVAMLSNAITQVAFRGVAVSGALGGKASRSALRLSAALAAAVLAASPLLPTVVVFVLGSQYKHAGTTIIVYGCGAALAAISQPLLGMLSAGGHDRVVSRLVGASVLLGLAVGTATVRPWGPVGMGLGFLLTQAVIAASCAAMYRRRQGAHTSG